MWASLAALADTSPICTGSGTGATSKSIGFANPALYIAATDGYAGNFNDVTSGSNGYQGVTGYTAQPGYDMTTGLGTPIAARSRLRCAATR